MRPHQWVKNLIVLVPLITSHQMALRDPLMRGLVAFAVFCWCASGVYVLNDLLDLDADRRHATKRARPLAAGDLPLAWALVLGPALLLLGLAAAAAFSPAFFSVALLYVATSFAYSWRLKRTALVDVFVLAGLYTIRLVAGHVATGVEFSEWLLAFSMFIFLSLALVKRYQEVERLRGLTAEPVSGRGYTAKDLEVMTSLGSTSGYLSILILALYVTSDKVRLLYHRPILLLLICPLLLYWISRVWLIAHRGWMNDDPVVFALKDKVSYLVGLLTLAIVWLAT
jgi:4-hydroxybenzoate polyprenyltransferase